LACFCAGLLLAACDSSGNARQGNVLGDDASVDDAAQIDAEVNEARSDASADASTWLDDTLAPLPERLTALVLYPALDQPDITDARVLAYEPRWPLWSNGSAKARYVYLSAPVNTQDRAVWSYAPGTVFFKTFFFGTGAQRRAVETRVL